MVVARNARPFTAAFLVGLLSSCGFFSSSTFPPVATQLAAQRDFSADIPTDFAGGFTLSTLTANGVDLVFLADSQPYDGPHLFVMDQDLNVLQTFSYQDLSLLSASFANTRAFLGASGNVLILRLDCPAGQTGISGFVPRAFSPGPGNFGFSDGTLNYAGFNVSGNQLSYTIYSNVWGYASSSTANISANPALSFQIVDISADPALSFATLILEETSSGQDYYFHIPVGSFGGTLTSPLTSYGSFTAPRADNGLAAYSQDGFISFQRASNAPGGTFVRLDLSGNTLPFSLPYNGSTDVQIAARASGGWYYVYDKTSRVVSRINAWWGR